jgi:peptidoglycan/LPS O-acetylase OafA/YrhL
MALFGITTEHGSAPIKRGGWLDILRFVVAVMIILHHFQAAGPFPLADWQPAFEVGGFLLTNFFLIDSGYVLARIYAERTVSGRVSAGEFFRRRFLRVVPAHLVMSVMLIALVVVTTALGMPPRHPEWFDWKELPAQLFLVQSFGVPGGIGWNAPTWSLSALLGCYLAFPWIMKLMARMPVITVVLLALTAYVLAHVLTTMFLGFPVYQMPLKYGFFRAFPLFLLGMALAEVGRRVYIPPMLARVVGIAATVGLFALVGMGIYNLANIGLICLIIAAAGAIPVVRKAPKIEFIAYASFAMFISNEVVRIGYFGVANVLIGKLGLGVATQWAIWGGGVLAAIAFGLLFYRFFDRPLQKWVQSPDNRLLRFRAPATAPSQAA